MSNFISQFILNSKWHRLFIFCVSIILYANTMNNDFVLDDNIVLKKNEFVKRGFSGMKDILIHDSFKGFFMDDQSGVSVSGGRYRPMTLLVFAALHPIFGLNAMWYHLLNVLVFAFLAVVIYSLISKLLENKFPDSTKPIAFLSALLFAIHPIHTECIANIKGLDEIFSLLFSSLAFIQCVEYINGKKLSSLALSFIYFLISIFSKESAINFIFLIPFGLLLFQELNWKNAFLSFTPILAAVILYLITRYQVIGIDKFNDVSRDVLTNPFLRIRGTNVTDASIMERLGMIFFSIGKYFQLMIFPHPLTHDYFPLHVKLQSLDTPGPILSLLFFVTLIILAIIKRKSNPILSYGLLSICIPLILISNLIFPMGTPMGERFAFTASLGFCLVIGNLMFSFLKRKQNTIAIGFLCLAFILLSFKTITRNADWKNEYTLFSKDVITSNNSIKAHSELAYHLIDKIKNTKDTSISNALISEAIPQLEKTVQLYPRHANAIYLIGNLYYLKKDYDKAATAYEKYLDLVPNGSDVVRNLQVCYREHGRELALKNQDLDKSIDLLIKSLKIKPNDARLLESLGIAYGMNAEFDQSIDYFNKAIEMDPNNAMMHVNLANSYYKKGDKIKGSELMKEAFKLDGSLSTKLMGMQKPYN